MARFGGRARSALVPVLLTLVPGAGFAQSSGYPTRPRPLPEAAEIALAMSAAPPEISAKATIYVLGPAGPMKSREGTNGCTCMVSRDLHEGSLYPICFDQEGSNSLLHQELLELRLRVEGKSEPEVKQAVAAAYAAGTLRPPARPAIAYMMSSRQVLFSSPLPEGRRAGAWQPHVMISVPNASEAQFGIPRGSSVDVVELERSGEPMAQLIVKVPQWADGPKAPPPPSPNPPLPSSPVSAAVRDSLRLADQRLSESASTDGLARALPQALASDAVLLFEGAPIVRGRETIVRLLAAQPQLQGTAVSWAPFRVLVSRDQTFGVTFGGTVVSRKGAPTMTGRYLTAWRRSETGAWQVAGHVQIGLTPPDAAVPGPGSQSAGPGNLDPPADPFAQADRAFAKLAADSGAPAAFGRFVAPDGMTLAGTGELNIGPAAVRARLAEGRAATAAWQWYPVISFGAASGDLGATIGEAEIRLNGADPNSVNYSKYLTVWQRQPDGSLKFVVDGGSSRPSGNPASITKGAPARPVTGSADGASVDALIAALYNVISGDSGIARDWDRFRSLFAPGAQMIPVGQRQGGAIAARVITPEEYIAASGPYLVNNGFHEREIARRSESYGQIVHTFSTYESRHRGSDKEPFMRGINSIQLYNDGARWWIQTVMWWAETPATPLPSRYLSSEKH